MPRPRRSFSPLWAGALIAAACARHAGARHAASPSRAQPVDVALHVTNHHWLDVTVSVEHDGQRTRIGDVTAAASAEFVLPLRVFGVSRTSIDTWLSKIEDGGVRALKSRPRGRPRQSRLPGWQAANVVRLIEGGCPDQLRLPFALWTREAVAAPSLRTGCVSVDRRSLSGALGTDAAEAAAPGV